MKIKTYILFFFFIITFYRCNYNDDENIYIKEISISFFPVYNFPVSDNTTSIYLYNIKIKNNNEYYVEVDYGEGSKIMKGELNDSIIREIYLRYEKINFNINRPLENISPGRLRVACIVKFQNKVDTLKNSDNKALRPGAFKFIKYIVNIYNNIELIEVDSITYKNINFESYNIARIPYPNE